MRILIVNKYWRELGGVETHTFAVAEHLRAQGHDVVPFAMHEAGTHDVSTKAYFPSNVEFRTSSPSEALKSIERATISHEPVKNLERLISEQKIDAAYVVHVYHQLGTAILNVLRDNNIPTVLSIHDYKIACPNYRFFSERSGKICTKCLDHTSGFLWAPVQEACWSGSRAAGVALVAEAIATRARKSYQQPEVVVTTNSLQDKAAVRAGVASDRLMRIPHPVELKAARTAPGTGGFVLIARLVPEKGVDVAIRASAESQLPLTVIGDGRDADALRSLARDLSAPVTFTGPLGLSETHEVLRSAWALLVPSVWHEVSPLVVYDAIAHDVPVIGSDVGGITDQLADGRGYLLPHGDIAAWSACLTEVATDLHAAQKRSETARAHARDNWSPEQWSRNLAEAFTRAGAPLSNYRAE